MFTQLDTFLTRPAPYSVYTADALWTRPHIAKQMLKHHLDEGTDIASRRPETIDSIVKWIDAEIDVSGKSVCDLGCGPGLYALRLAKLGANISGIDFSEVSIAYATELFAREALSAEFSVSDYLKSPLPSDQDLFLLIYGDYSVLSPDQRKTLLKAIHSNLKPGGRVILDSFYLEDVSSLEETLSLEPDSMGGFWAPSPYFGFKKTFVYPEQHLSLDRYLIVDEKEQFEIYNWLKFFRPQDLCSELEQSGFSSVRAVDVATGEPFQNTIPSQFAVIAQRE